ncbi:MAG TPA: HNH endonuclease signature motif containing protein [Candidatus Binatia bacterium]|nr:HNH endonuclease signature motif containing protein [Candidatus Binatia bacterium]
MVDVGRTRRVPGAATRRALLARDAGCVWPGCDRPVTLTEAHHLTHWARGGSTDLANLVNC